jgi:hypothetical protein
VEGLNRSSFGVGVLGTLAGGSGVPKPGLAGIAVWGDGNNGVAGTGKYFGVIGVSGTGVGVSADSTSGYGLRAHSSGNLAIYCDGQGQYTVSWSKTSDARFKENVEPLERALERTLMLRGVSFDWRRDEFPERHFSTHRDIGFLAQEVEEVYPHLVTTDREGYKSVDYSALTPILVEAIKAQQGTISDLQARIEELRERFDRLERNSTDSGARTAERRDPQERGRVAEEKEAAR